VPRARSGHHLVEQLLAAGAGLGGVEGGVPRQLPDRGVHPIGAHEPVRRAGVPVGEPQLHAVRGDPVLREPLPEVDRDLWCSGPQLLLQPAAPDPQRETFPALVRELQQPAATLVEEDEAGDRHGVPDEWIEDAEVSRDGDAGVSLDAQAVPAGAGVEGGVPLVDRNVTLVRNAPG
jgi:hypothetical protein